MMSAKHSPGPWKAVFMPQSSNMEYAIHEARGERIATIDYVGNSDTESANARLVAAAPATLAALEQLIADIVQMVGDRSCYGMPIASEEHPWHSVIADARAAVAAAKGE